jgi:hypothetical protein
MSIFAAVGHEVTRSPEQTFCPDQSSIRQTNTITITVKELSICGSDKHVGPINEHTVQASTHAVARTQAVSAQFVTLLTQTSPQDVQEWAKVGTYYIRLEWTFSGTTMRFRTRHRLVPECSFDVDFEGDMEWAFRLLRHSKALAAARPVETGIMDVLPALPVSIVGATLGSSRKYLHPTIDRLVENSDPFFDKLPEAQDNQRQVKEQIEFDMKYRVEREAWELYDQTGDTSGLVALLNWPNFEGRITQNVSGR